MGVKNWVLALVLVVLACGAENRLDVKEYINVLKSSSTLVKHGGNNSCKYILVYKPSDLMLAMDIENKNLATREVDSLRTLYSRGVYVDFKHMKCNEHPNPRVVLLNGLDTVLPSFSYKEGAGGITPYVTDLHIFPRVNEGDLKFCVLMDTSSTLITYDVDELRKLPKLKI